MSTTDLSEFESKTKCESTKEDNGIVLLPTLRNTERPSLNWTRLNYRGEDHDRRRLLEHRARDCHCEVCDRELKKLPPDDPLREKYAARKMKEEEREKKRVKKKAKREVKEGKQACIRNFFRY